MLRFIIEEAFIAWKRMLLDILMLMVILVRTQTKMRSKLLGIRRKAIFVIKQKRFGLNYLLFLGKKIRPCTR